MARGELWINATTHQLNWIDKNGTTVAVSANASGLAATGFATGELRIDSDGSGYTLHWKASDGNVYKAGASGTASNWMSTDGEIIIYDSIAHGGGDALFIQAPVNQEIRMF